MGELKCWRGYFLPGLISYSLGLLATMVVLEITGAGQPALLYLVPCTLGTALTAGYCRGDLLSLWHGTPLADEDGAPGTSDEDEAAGAVALVSWHPRAMYRQRKGQPFQEETDPCVIGTSATSGLEEGNRT